MSKDKSANISVYFGSDEGQATQAAVAAYRDLSAGGDGWGDEIIEGVAATVDEAVSLIHRTISSLRTMNMFGGRKVIWLRGVTFMGDSPQGTRSASVVSALEELLAALESLDAETFFILSSMEMDKRRVFFKRLEKLCNLREFSKIDISKQGWENELSAMVVTMANARSLRFESSALDLFVHRVHENSRQIANELDKLSVYLGKEERPLSQRDIELMVAVSRDGIIFEISRALEQRNAPAAIALIDAQLARGEAAVAIMRAAFIPTLRNRYCVRLLMESYGVKTGNYRDFESSLRKLPPAAMKLLPLKKDGTPNAYGLFSAARSLGKIKLSGARDALRACAAADCSLVSTSTDARQLLHQLVVRVCA